jgi:threonylcarbamoyladenosine tRNA methylthiotransferase MtaB
VNPTTVSFKTVGCRLNQAETAQMRAAFEAAGYLVKPFGAACDISVIHGCLVTARAEKDGRRLARSVKRRHRKTFVVIAGCAAEIDGESARRAAGADLAAGQRDKFALPALLARHGFPDAASTSSPEATHPRPYFAQEATKDRPLLPAPKRLRQAGQGGELSQVLTPRFDTTRAIVKIQDGCEFNCAYCIVPRARGRCWSRPLPEVLDEVRRLAAAGHREIVLTGANIGCYEYRGRRLAHLLERLENETDIERLRLSSIEITTAERAVIDFMAGSTKLCRFLHLPLQSGCDAVLAAMGRRYSARQYRETIEYAAAKLGPVGLGTDVLAGFPGEDAAAFAETERFVAGLPFSNLHVFGYSPRPGTPAAERRDQVPEPEKRRRVARLIELGDRLRADFARQWVGREVQVLVESVDASGRAEGWTGEYLPARIGGRELRPNSIVTFRPQTAEGEILVGIAPDG